MSAWWSGLSAKQQSTYLKAHPSSKYKKHAKSVKKAVKTAAAKKGRTRPKAQIATEAKMKAWRDGARARERDGLNKYKP